MLAKVQMLDVRSEKFMMPCLENPWGYLVVQLGLQSLRALNKHTHTHAHPHNADRVRLSCECVSAKKTQDQGSYKLENYF